MLYLALFFFISSIFSFFIGVADAAGFSIAMHHMQVVIFLCLSVTSAVFFFLQRKTEHEDELLSEGHNRLSF